MKISQNTIAILKNFSTINGNFWYPGEGNVISTISPMGNIFANATIEEDFAKEFCIYELSDFLSVISIAEEPWLVLQDTHAEISWKSSKLKYGYADSEIFDVENSSFKYLKAGFTMPECEISFRLDAENIIAIRKASAVLKAQNISISSSDGGIIQLTTYDKTNPNSNRFEIYLPETTPHKFNMELSIENLRIIAGDYIVNISSNNTAHFQKSTNDVNYYIAMDESSAFQQ